VGWGRMLKRASNARMGTCPAMGLGLGPRAWRLAWGLLVLLALGVAPPAGVTVGASFVVQGDPGISFLHIHLGEDEHAALSAQASTGAPLAGQNLILVQPPVLVFKNTPLCIPAVALIDVVNRSPDKDVQLLGITSQNPQFYPAMFKPQVLPPYGRSSVQVIFLPRSLGAVETNLMVSAAAENVTCPPPLRTIEIGV
jgi:hypothetical protein